MNIADTCTVYKVEYPDGTIMISTTYHSDEPDGRCHDCGIKHGGLYHPGCDVEQCPKCGGPVKPDVVLYEEGLNQKTLEDAIYCISHADVLIVGGTSLAVYPAAGLIDYYNGNKLVLINKSTTPMDARADLLIQQGLGSVFEQIEV